MIAQQSYRIPGRNINCRNKNRLFSRHKYLKREPDDHELDADEKEILDSVERGEWRSARAPKRAKGRYGSYAKATFRKDRRLNIRISTKDLEAIQKRALEEGLPYQTLIASLLHEYASGRLREA
jgi:predicted DNA binding CopG/RHH family protein